MSVIIEETQTGTRPKLQVKHRMQMAKVNQGIRNKRPRLHQKRYDFMFLLLIQNWVEPYVNPL